MGFYGIQLRPILQEVLKISNHKMSLKNALVKSISDLSRATELKINDSNAHYIFLFHPVNVGQVLWKYILITAEANALCHVLTDNDNLIPTADTICQS